MQIVIDIDEALYEYMQSRYKYQNKGDEGLSTAEEAGIAIKNGTVLPKGHGRLIDASRISLSQFFDAGDYSQAMRGIYDAPTIIPADTESEADNDT